VAAAATGGGEAAKQEGSRSLGRVSSRGLAGEGSQAVRGGRVGAGAVASGRSGLSRPLSLHVVLLQKDVSHKQ
jgi:hypothetical protein